MNTSHTCPQCHQPLPDDAPEGLCPACLIKELAAATNVLPPGSTPPRGSVDIADITEVAKRLPQFEIIELLGRGGMGVVYKVRQAQLDRIVALKILPPEESHSPDFVERFRREARSLAKLSHPNIVHVYDFGEGGGLYFIVMEFVEGANLRQLLQAKQLAAPEALAIVPKICDALQYAHEEGIMHRDIKPENILVDKKGRVKIADFGLAKLLHRDPAEALLTMSGMTVGTPRYMAPEQMDKPETVDHRADIYSLGVVFYEMLTGELPMGRFAPPSQKVQVDVRLDEIVLHAMERDVERRYQHVSEIKTDVQNVTSTPQVAPEGPAATSGATESGARLLLEGTDLPARQRRRPFKTGGFIWIVIGLVGGAIVFAVKQYDFLPMAVGFLALGVGSIVMAGSIRQRWQIDYLGHSVRFESSLDMLGHLMIDGKIMASGEIGPQIELSARIPGGRGAGDRIVVKTFARTLSLQCQLFVEPKESTHVAAVTDPIPEDKAKPVVLSPLPRFFWLRAFVRLMLGWVAFAALWNYGLTGFVAGAVVMAAILSEVGRGLANRNPEWVEKIRAASTGHRFAARSVKLLWLALLVMVFIWGQFLLWDSSQMRANIDPPLSSEEFEAKYKGKEYQLIRQLDAFKQQVPAAELVQEHWHNWPSTWSESSSIGTDGFSWLMTGWALAMLYSFFTLSGWEVAGPDLKPRSGSWRAGWKSMGVLLVSLKIACLALMVRSENYLNGRPMTNAATTVQVRANVKQASDALHQWAAEHGYESASTGWGVLTVPKGERVAHVEVFHAWKDSPFESWRMTGIGLQRSFPHIAVQVDGTDKPAQAEVMINPGFDLGGTFEPGSEKEKRWKDIVKSLADAVSKAAAFDPTKQVQAPPLVKHAETGSPWLGLCGVLAAALLWIFVRIRWGRLEPAR